MADAQETTTLTLPARYARDWYSRCGEDLDVDEPQAPSWRSRNVTLTLTPEALEDLVDDVKHYTDPEMLSDFWESCPGVVTSARAARKRLEQAGVL